MSFAADYNNMERPGSLSPRGTFIPPWYEPHKDLSLPVTGNDGLPLGFTIGDVAVERRWAIDPAGKVMHGYDFKDRLTEWYIGQWSWQHPPQPPLPVDTSGYPTPENYVAKGPNPANIRQLISLARPNHRAVSGVERPVDTQQLQRAGWTPAPKKE